MKYGRSDAEWAKLVSAASDYLVEVAKKRSLTNYTDLSAELVGRTGQPRFDYNLERDQAAVGALLGEVTDATFDEIGAMLSSLVVQKATGDPGEGFYRLAKRLGLMQSAADKVECFSSQVSLVHAHYAR